MRVSQLFLGRRLMQLGHALANRIPGLILTVPQDGEVRLVAFVLLSLCVPAWVRATKATGTIFVNIKDWIFRISTLLSRAQVPDDVG
mmetsp:Transcript_47671/g.87635  ORF Transcript_47671/g.87635 Transcript_47671/m.87635 type:complete len:87 (-) Transcript_47671:398-658(-)